MRTATTLSIMFAREPALGGCGDDIDAQPIDTMPVDEMPIDAPDIDAAPQAYTTVMEFPSTPNRNLDLLFVIDDSPSMADKQSNLATNFPTFVNQLVTASGGLPNLHIGVISTDMGMKGTAVVAPGPATGVLGQGGCVGSGDDGALQLNGAAVTGMFITDVEGTGGERNRNYTSSLASTFSQMARLGAGGCGFEQPCTR